MTLEQHPELTPDLCQHTRRREGGPQGQRLGVTSAHSTKEQMRATKKSQKHVE